MSLDRINALKHTSVYFLKSKSFLRVKVLPGKKKNLIKIDYEILHYHMRKIFSYNMSHLSYPT